MKKEYEYVKLVKEMFDEIFLSQDKNIEKLIDLFISNIKEDKIIHLFGTGHSHMPGMELFVRAGGLANINAMLDLTSIQVVGARKSGALEKVVGLADEIYDSYDIREGDLMIISSNSGRNVVPIEMAIRAKKEGVYVVVLTNLAQSKITKSRHSSNKNLYEYGDLVIDTCVSFGDSLMEVDNIKTGPASTLASIIILNTVVTETIKRMKANDLKVKVFQSQNLDKINNEDLYLKYSKRVKHM